MQIRIKKTNQDGIVRLETQGDIKEILINEEILHDENESISVCFRGKNSSGIIDLSPDEIEKLFKAVQNKVHLIKSFKKYSSSGAYVFK